MTDLIKIGAVATAVVAIGAAVILAKDVIGVPPFVSKSEVAEVNEELIEVASKAQTNRILILNDRLQRALAEKRGYEQSGKRIPQSLEEWIRDLCQKLKEEGAGCR